MGSEEASELIVQTDSVSPKTVGESIFIEVRLVLEIVGTGSPGHVHCVLSKPVIQPLAAKTPIAGQRVLQAEPADPTPAPVITSPFTVVVIKWSVAEFVIGVMIPLPVGVSAAGGRIEQRPVIVQRDTQASANRSHEIDCCLVGMTKLVCTALERILRI